MGKKFLYRHRVALSAAAIVLAIAATVSICLYALVQTSASVRLVVVIDAGHGGIDGGVVGVTSGAKESDINLAVARRLQAQFEEAGFLVVQTRPTEAGLYGAAVRGYKQRDMRRRAEIIRESEPAAVISVHQNYFSDRTRRGAQVFFRPSDARSRTLACAVQAALNAMPECVRRSEPLAGDYYILNNSACPAVIVECGFLSNAADEALLLDAAYRERLAETVCAGTLSYLAALTSGVP